MDELLLATSNQHKFREMADEIEEIGIACKSLADLNIELTRPESGETYRENARIKAEEGYDKSNLPSLADDSGLEVDALDGQPGIHSARWGGEDASSSEKNKLLLEELEGVETEDRTARYVCCMILFDESGTRFATRGVCEGRIAREPSGEGGFGYDPIFEVKQANWHTFGQLPESIKNWISHRAIALNQMISLMKDREQ